MVSVEVVMTNGKFKAAWSDAIRENNRVMELENKHFILYRKRVQRKTGGCKNKWVISAKMLTLNLPDHADAVAIMESFGGEDFGPRSRVFRRYSDAEKAWVYLSLRWS